jgi:ribosomal protein S20
LFGFLEIFEVVPGAGLGAGKANRKGTQRNSEVKSSLRSLVRQAKPGFSTELKREQHDKIVSIMKPTWR